MHDTPRPGRSPEELLAKAAELRGMAATATTQDVRDALLRLAERYAAMAVVRVPEIPVNDLRPGARQCYG